MPNQNWGKTGISADVLNAIRAQASTNYQNYVPIAQPGTNDVFSIGNVILDHVDVRNEFLNILPNVIKNDDYFKYEFTNPFERFYFRGNAEETDVIQHIFVDGPDTVPYDIADSESFTQHYDPKIKTAYWYQRAKYQQNWTIAYDELKLAFKNEVMFQNFLANIREKSEYQKTVYSWFFCQYMAYFLASFSNITSLTSSDITTLISRFLTAYYCVPENSLYDSVVTEPILLLDCNALALDETLNYHLSNLYEIFHLQPEFIIMQADAFHAMNVNLIENFKGNVIKRIYLMCDHNTFSYYDTLDTTRVFDNPQTLSYNFTRNIRQIYGISPYAQAIKGTVSSN